MTTLFAQPQLMATAAADAASINSAINEARAAAAGPTTSLVAAAQDEVSAVTAAFFGGFGADYQALLQQANVFHEQFAAALAAAGNAYTQAEIDAQSALGITPLANPVFGTFAGPTTNSLLTLIMTGSGTATPSSTYMAAVNNLFVNSTGELRAVSTAEGLYPFTGTKDLTLDISLARGVTELENAIGLATTPGGTPINILGYSQSSIIASMVMPALSGHYGSTQLNFTLLGDPSAPNGGLFARFPGLSLPSLGETFGTSTPANLFNTTIYTLEYDGFADFPQYPIDVLADVNALAGIVFVHGTYPTLSATQIASGFLLPGSVGIPGTVGSMTNYVMIPTANLPLLDPLRAIPIIGNPLADLMQPDLTALINWGYGNPAYGFSTGPANIQTPFGFLPPLGDTLALGPALVSGTQAGFNAFAADLSGLVPTSLPALPNLSLSSLTSVLGGGAAGSSALALPTSIPSAITSVISGIESANTNIVGTFTTDFSTAYATLLPTADIATAVVVSLPSYDVNLFLNGIAQAVNGQPLQGLMNAIGEPISADIGLGTLAGGFELLSIENTLDTILTGTPNPGPF